ncbi:hypothetical protein KW807_00805 [Candidatus Parcubacteria bacterium]|nr:hypothetical protein [Candidatus Parcubacteria bacterium]
MRPFFGQVRVCEESKVAITVPHAGHFHPGAAPPHLLHRCPENLLILDWSIY